MKHSFFSLFYIKPLFNHFPTPSRGAYSLNQAEKVASLPIWLSEEDNRP